MWADPATGTTRVVTEDTDKDWVDVNAMEWIEDHPSSNAQSLKDPLFLSERDEMCIRDRLTPPGLKDSLHISEYAWSADAQKLLVFTNAKKVWRAYTRGDYWVYDTTAAPGQRLVKLDTGARCV